jgi:hypothetical protein
MLKWEWGPASVASPDKPPLSIGMLDSHSDTAHVQGWQFVASLVESKAPNSSSVRMVQM